ncbi:MAG: hypothetical protein ACR2HR_09650 [Euzebya sp.]
MGLPVPDPWQWHATFVERFYPYGSAYLSDTGFVGGEVRDAAAGVFRALEADPPQEADHLAVLLSGYATVDANGWGPARSTLLWQHLLPWTLPYLDRMRTDAPECYRRWATLLFDTLSDVAARVARPSGAALTLTTSTGGLADPRDAGEDAFVTSLLAPARLGAIVTRDDLLQAAQALDLHARIGERRYLLKGLITQDPPGLLRWLSRHCDHTGRRAGQWPAAVADIGLGWSRRAQASASLLAELSE